MPKPGENPLHLPIQDPKSLKANKGMSQEEIDQAFQKAGGVPKAQTTRLYKSTYKPEYCQDLIDFFNKPPTREIVETWYHTDGSVKRESMREVPNSPPHLGQWALKIGVWPNLPYEWAREHEEFATALMCARTLRKHLVIDNALKGLYNPIFSKLAAANWFNWHEKQDVNHTVTSTMVTYHKPEREALPDIQKAIEVAPPPSLPSPKDED
jgi:hypothetical protein